MGEWEFLYIHTNVLFRFAITAERIRTSYENKLVVRNVSANPQRLNAFVKAVRTTTFTPTNNRLDVRYGFIVCDKQNRELLTLFMDFSNQLVLFDGKTYHVSGELSKWFIEYARAITKMI